MESYNTTSGKIAHTLYTIGYIELAQHYWLQRYQGNLLNALMGVLAVVGIYWVLMRLVRYLRAEEREWDKQGREVYWENAGVGHAFRLLFIWLVCLTYLIPWAIIRITLVLLGQFLPYFAHSIYFGMQFSRFGFIQYLGDWLYDTMGQHYEGKEKIGVWDLVCRLETMKRKEPISLSMTYDDGMVYTESWNHLADIMVVKVHMPNTGIGALWAQVYTVADEERRIAEFYKTGEYSRIPTPPPDKLNLFRDVF